MAVKKIPAAKKEGEKRELRITLVRSLIGYPQRQRETAKGLGLRKINSRVIRPDRPEIRGMINKISHLVKVEVVEK
ncbi:MAG: 50S ribosomal protein L30 [Candidatus Aminicenantes bacterium RBG_19FT_COMBO_58_17]|jgi:large subunit ribosomal protein L30|nr:MAG: 50S ribosomal protein L30 [Candidatus Aminicenantes bacterium RBG_19FT_COMBO_58_17]HCS49673.1 50S ribosomal protein L30 [Candidatus Aminicenantes bacterium]